MLSHLQMMRTLKQGSPEGKTDFLGGQILQSQRIMIMNVNGKVKRKTREYWHWYVLVSRNSKIES